MKRGYQRVMLGTFAVAVCCVCWGATSLVARNNAFRRAILLPGPSGSDTTTADTYVYASTEKGEPAHAGRGPFRSLWWKYQPPANGYLTLDTHGSRKNTVLGLYTGPAVAELTQVASNDDDGSARGNSGLYEIPVIGNVLYNIAVASSKTSNGYGYGYGFGYRLNWRYAPAQGRIVYRSAGVYDGWVLESRERSNRGGSRDASGSLRVGDDEKDRQYRSILSFDTRSIPDKAVILSAKLKLKRERIEGTNPFKTHGALVVDIGQSRFGASAALGLDDFSAPAAMSQAGRVGRIAVGRIHIANLAPASFAKINKTGPTQLRLRYAKDDNDDLSADLMSFFGGNAARLSRPVLEIKYTTP